MTALTPDTSLRQGLARLGMALRLRDAAEARAGALSPLQAQALVVLRGEDGPLRLGLLAERLAVTAPTASEAVAALARKGLVAKSPDPEDGRARAIALTAAGRRAARNAASWPEFLSGALSSLEPEEGAVLLRALTKMIRSLQEAGEIPPSRLCVDCIHFRPHVHDDRSRPHHCAFVDAAFGDDALRIDCADHIRAAPDRRQALWAAFLSRAAMDHEPVKDHCHDQPQPARPRGRPPARGGPAGRRRHPDRT